MSRHPGNQLFAPPPPEVGDTGTLPSLRGSQRQITWSETIRAAKLAGCRKLIKDWLAYAENLKRTNETKAAEERKKAFAHGEYLEWLERQDGASWWIDRRDNSPTELLNNSLAKPGDSYGDAYGKRTP